MKPRVYKCRGWWRVVHAEGHVSGAVNWYWQDYAKWAQAVEAAIAMGRT